MIADEKNNRIFNCAIIVLAAGASNRLGRPKQLLIHRGKSLLQNVMDVAKSVNARPIIGVLGANSHLTAKEIQEDKNVYKIINEDWSEGISSSIRCGLKFLQQISPSSDAAIFMVCDQPFITGSLLNNLIAAQKETGKPIVASSYDNTIGTPVLFHKNLFGELMDLKGDVGAKNVIRQHAGSFVTISFPMGNIDIDTTADYAELGHTKP
jgi:molybdenum cofactor cytidylyltransferase